MMGPRKGFRSPTRKLKAREKRIPVDLVLRADARKTAGLGGAGSAHRISTRVARSTNEAGGRKNLGLSGRISDNAR